MKSLVIIAYLSLMVMNVAAQQDADIVFYNAKVYTADESQSFAEAIAITDDTIVFIGDSEAAEDYIGQNTQSIDLDGKLLLPGLHDIHMHPMEASSEASATCILESSEENPEVLAQNLDECNPEPNSNGWITAWGHSIFSLLDYNGVPKELLDDYFPNTPVAIMEESSHSFWVNSAALEELGIDENTEDPIGGHIVLDPITLEPNGLLLDSAGDLANEAALTSNETIDDQNYDGLVNFGLPLIARNGITSICEGRTYWKRGYHEIWSDIHEAGLLTARVNLAPWGYPEDEDAEQLVSLSELYDEGDDYLRTNQIKVYIDGITSNGTAATDEPYIFYFGWPFEQGLNYFTEERLGNYIAELELLGYDFHIHAIGNRGVHEALNAIEFAKTQNGEIGSRHRITHIELVNEADLLRFQQLGVIADAQVAGAWTNPNQWFYTEELVGSDIAWSVIPIKSLFDAGAHVTLSSDWDVSSISPFNGIRNALNRAPENLPTVADAVDAYTIKAAFAMGHETMTGSLEVGKWADLICVDRDIFTIGTNQIAQTQVEMTMLGGDIIYASENFDLGLSEEEKDQFKVFPTLASEEITVKSDFLGEVQVQILDANGKQVYADAQNFSGKKRIDVTSFSEGVYTLLIVTSPNSMPMNHKFIISK